MNTDVKEYNYVDCFEMNNLYPDTFHIPTQQDIDALKVGDFVKVHFKTSDDEVVTERMWVQLESIEDGVYIGSLANDPYVIDDISYGDRFKFHQNNIAMVLEQ